MTRPFRPYTTLLLALSVALWSCETVIDADLDEGPTQLAVDGTITDETGPQTIRLTQTAAYFDNRPAPPAVGATVAVIDDRGRTYAFVDPDNDGRYVWQPANTRDTLGRIGQTYRLAIQYNGETYASVARMNRVPVVDSIIFRQQRLNPLSEERGYAAEFFATDFAGALDYYRVRYFRNGTLQNRPQDIILVYDAAFAGSADTDGIQFIRPIRQSINPENLYQLNDTVRVEIRSLSAEGYVFWNQLRAEIQNGGLFATPPTNVPTNVLNVNSTGPRAVGFFGASAVRSRTVVVSPENTRPE